MSIEINRNVCEVEAVREGIKDASTKDQLQVLAAILNSCWSEDFETGEKLLDEEKLVDIVENLKSFIISDKSIEKIFEYLKIV